jgi:hypothetical protein
MELKCSGGIPLWMTEALSKGHMYKTSFSKYGTAYQTQIFPVASADAIAKREIRQAAELQSEKTRAARTGIEHRIFAGHRQSVTA